jgi:NADH-quinone oxidoreductase subunit C
VALFLKEDADFSFDLIVDVLGIDRYGSADRFEVVYIVYSLKNKQYLRFRVTLAEEHPAVATVTNVWPGANWYEREAYDMFGIRFEGHPDLRRMYMPEEFEYYPLRKDFPLMGIPDSLPLPRR